MGRPLLSIFPRHCICNHQPHRARPYIFGNISLPICLNSLFKAARNKVFKIKCLCRNYEYYGRSVLALIHGYIFYRSFEIADCEVRAVI